jgi:O-antigen/teichoic acid export membrane protein
MTIRAALDWGLRHVREPLFLHAYALALSGLLTSGLGVVYWALAARLYPAEVVGVNAALISLITLLANVSQLNLRSGFGRFVPEAGPRVGRLLAAGYVSAGIVALLSSGLLVLALSAIPALAPVLAATPSATGLFIVTAVAWTLFGLQDNALTALRRTVWVPVENAVFAVLKIALLVGLAGFAGTFAILVSWTIPMVVLIAIISAWIFRSVVPAYRRADAAASPTHGGHAGHTGRGASTPLSARAVVSFIGVDYAGTLFAIASTALLPVIVLTLLGPAASAHFYIVVMVASGAELLPTVLSTSLRVGAAASEASFERDGRRVVRQLATIVGPLVVVLVVAAPLILGIFGGAYAAEGSDALRLYALAGVPFSLIQLSFIRLRLERRVRWVLASQVVLAVANVAGSLALLPRLGLVGAGLTTLVAESVVALFLVRAELWGVVLGPSRSPAVEGATNPRPQPDPDPGRSGRPQPAAVLSGSDRTPKG